jgi:arabinosaccharide transport system permease protein
MKSIKKLLFSQNIAPYVFVLPFILTFCIFFIYPVFLTTKMSFEQILPGQETFIGMANYKALLKPTFFQAVTNSIKYTIFTLLLLIPIPMVLACFLNSKIMIAKNFFRSTLFVPALTSAVVAGTIFRLIFGELPGSLMNTIVGIFGVSPLKWLDYSTTGFISL